MLIVIGALIVLTLLYLWCLKGRAAYPGWETLRKYYYAHRGLHNGEKPENSLSALRAAVEHGYGAELDIHLLRDGNLAVVHDSSLKRTAGADVAIESLSTEELMDYRLLGTDEPIPTLQQVLEVFEGKAPLIVELKVQDDNYAALCEAACRLLDNYRGAYCIESFDPRAVAWFRKNRPEVIRGQLSQNWMGKKHPIPMIIRWIMTYHLGNVVSRPDFIAYKFADRHVFGTEVCRKFWKLQGVAWTIRSPQDLKTAVQEGWLPIFEGFEP